MARKKEYKEEEVIDKAMNLFWNNGYETTSMQMLEKEMGINKFSIYSSFGSKKGVLLESVKLYKRKLNTLIDRLKSSSNGAEGIKQYFYDFIKFSKKREFGKGCLVVSTMNELGISADLELKEIANRYSIEIDQAFCNNLSQDVTKSKIMIEQQKDYLILSLMGLTFATRTFDEAQLDNYIKHVFKNV